ncbi:Fur family transcriptional regulator [Deinococcus lacus]|uniref:Fur family transcriptional regulator n=1 Tax=Deinococcus lacus TaxID=392561 RepID=A0ABW1YHC1_9DEIO
MTRSTRQRGVIARILETAEGPLAVNDIHLRASQDLPRLGIATVYRTLKLLAEQQQIHAVTLDGETRYEAVGKGHHHHFSCNYCGRVFTVYNCPVQLPAGTEYPGGFVIEGHEITLYGRCPDCQKTQGPS